MMKNQQKVCLYFELINFLFYKKKNNKKYHEMGFFIIKLKKNMNQISLDFKLTYIQLA
jgi:hypothetical protein